jgi:hypothetical protein
LKEELIPIIKELTLNSTPGIDQVINEIIQNIREDDLTYIIKLMNVVQQNKTIPNLWKHARIYPIFKGTGSEFVKDDYRPIALLQTLYKLYSAVINDRLLKVLERRGILPQEQTGFRPAKSTANNIQALIEIIIQNESHQIPR